MSKELFFVKSLKHLYSFNQENEISLTIDYALNGPKWKHTHQK
jgi:hypothetical protein